MRSGYKKSSTKPSVLKAYAGDVPEMKPRVSLNSKLLSEIKGWKVGKEYSIDLKVKMTGLHEEYDSDGLCGDFEILSAEVEN